MSGVDGEWRAALRARLIEPTVERRPRRFSIVFAVIGIAILAVWLFFELESRRALLTEPDLFAAETSQGAILSPPGLALPAAPLGDSNDAAGASARTQEDLAPVAPTVALAPAPPGIREQPSPQRLVRPSSQEPLAPAIPVLDRGRGATTAAISALVFDQGIRRSEDAPAGATHANDTLRPEPLIYGPNILARGTRIAAVLETPLDTARGGIAIAVVSTDIRGFGSARTLVPRGARLFGQFRLENASSDSRIAINWERLELPDGRQVTIDFTGTDRKGVPGLEGRVHSNEVGRFAAGLLQTVLNVATFRALSEADSGTLIIGNAVQPPQLFDTNRGPRRKITVAAGTKIIVVVGQPIEF